MMSDLKDEIIEKVADAIDAYLPQDTGLAYPTDLMAQAAIDAIMGLNTGLDEIKEQLAEVKSNFVMACPFDDRLATPDYAKYGALYRGINLSEKLITLLAIERAKNEKLREALDPRRWSQEMSDAWHKNLPDTIKAFEAIRKLALKEQS